MITKKTILLTVCMVLVSSVLFAKQYKMKPDSKAMMEHRQQMMAEMQAMDKALDEKVARMNAATGEDRLPAAIDVINEFVSQHKVMREKMMRINEQEMMRMQEHMGEGMPEKSMMQKEAEPVVPQE
ncbi:MAG: hypothetical protein PHY78_07825 [Desulfobacterales bacterium]|nr:hypothetical protein [Desulfobacterales bacterium]MDD4392792.1 hypothetical protein [Desulfobacterales bacterium]